MATDVHENKTVAVNEKEVAAGEHENLVRQFKSIAPCGLKRHCKANVDQLNDTLDANKLGLRPRVPWKENNDGDKGEAA